MSTESPLPGARANEGPSPGPRRSSVGPTRVILALALPAFCLAAAIAARRTGWPRDHAANNVVILLLLALSGASLLTWFLCFSPLTRRARLISLAALFALAGAAAALLRIEQVTGELVPTLTWRWTRPPDERLEQPAPEPGGDPVDLLSTSPADFPQFLGPHRNVAYESVSLARDWTAAPPRLRWRQPIGAGWSAFAVVNGFAVTMEQRGEQELVVCYEAATGRIRWRHAVRTRHETVLGGTGPRGTPTIHEGKVYALGATGVLRCLNGRDGEEIWRRDLLRELNLTPDEDLNGVKWGRAASPLVVDQLVVTPFGGAPKRGPYHSLAAYHKDTGEPVWRAGDRQVGYSSPSEARLLEVRQILSVNEDNVSSHEPATGRLLWRHDWPGVSTSTPNCSQAVPLPGDRVLLSKAYGGGAELLQLRRSDDGAFLVETVWRDTALLKTKFANVAVFEGYAYALSDGVLECVELESGRRAWKGGRYGHGQILRVGELLLVQEETGSVTLAEASPRGLSELGRFQAIEGKTWNNVALYGRLLLVRNSVEAACYELPLEP